MKDGGTAFPRTLWTSQSEMPEIMYTSHPGMSLRDYFAGQALMGAIAEGAERGLGRSRAEELAEFSYACADAMLNAREG